MQYTELKGKELLLLISSLLASFPSRRGVIFLRKD